MPTVIRSDEQLVLITREKQVFEGLYYGKPPKVWTGSIEIERKEYRTYDDILAHVSHPNQIMKALRIGMSDGSVEDITIDVIEAAREKEFAA